jgi:glucokinase
MLLAGDIGGTKTHLGIYAERDNLRAPLRQATFPSADYPDLQTLVSAFLAQTQTRVERACFGVAGPVVAGRVSVTNLPWMLDEQQLQTALHIPTIKLINDLTALSSAVPALGPDDLCTLNVGRPQPEGTLAVIAPGTGLGEGYLTWDGARYRPYASEGGHTDFGPTDPVQAGLLRYMQGRMEHVSYEIVCSGLGLPHIYAYLRDSGLAQEPSALAAQIAAAEDPTPIIVRSALHPTDACPLCAETLNLFVSILGAETGNLALKVLATGGVYLGGGIPPRILATLQQGRFLEAFLAKGRMRRILVNMPVHVILHSQAALLGAARYGWAL